MTTKIKPKSRKSTAADVVDYKIPCERRHPDWEGKVCHWAFLLSTYESNRDWFRENIFKFSREGSKTYAGRIERAYRFNHTREVVDLVNKYLYKEKPVRSEDVSDAVMRFRKRATLSGLTLEAFEPQVSRKASIFGRVYVVVDNNNVPESGELEDVTPTISVADEKQGDVRLYAYIVEPQDFLDCAFDDNGQYEWVMIREVVRDDIDPLRASGVCDEKFRLWTKTGWMLFVPRKQKAPGAKERTVYALEAQGEHGLGMVPVVKCDHIENDNPYTAPALIEDIAYLDRAVANYLSNLDQIINDQTFSQLTIPAQALMGRGSSSPMASDDENDPDTIKTQRRLLKLGTDQVLPYDGEGGNKPEYISPDPRQAQLIIATIKQVINEIYHTVGLAGERTKQDNSLGIDNSSGVAKAYDFEKVNGLLCAKAAAMQNFANRIEQLVDVWHGVKPSVDQPLKNAVVYSTNFDVRSLSDDITIATQFGLMSIPMPIRRKQLAGLVAKLWPLLKIEEEKTLLSAIANWEDDTYASTGPGSTAPGDKSPVTDSKEKGAPGTPKR